MIHSHTYNLNSRAKPHLLLLMALILGIFVGCNSSKPSVEVSEDEELQAEEDTTEVTDTTDAIDPEQAEYRELLEEEYEKNLQEQYQGKANGVTTFYANAQRSFYARNFQAALFHINKAAEIKATPDVLALRGSIHLAVGETQKFLENWRLALQMDPDLPIPNVPFVINELKEHGLLPQNYQPNN